MKTLKQALETYCELHWWNMGSKTLSFKGDLKELLEKQGVSYRKRKTDTEGIYKFTFKNDYGITFTKNGLMYDFPDLAKRFIQMELVRMGDKSQLYVQGTFRPTVSVNF
jgi:hypothetical protein